MVQRTENTQDGKNFGNKFRILPLTY